MTIKIRKMIKKGTSKSRMRTESAALAGSQSLTRFAGRQRRARGQRATLGVALWIAHAHRATLLNKCQPSLPGQTYV
jgi:hypothetical protein